MYTVGVGCVSLVTVGREVTGSFRRDVATSFFLRQLFLLYNP